MEAVDVASALWQPAAASDPGGNKSEEFGAHRPGMLAYRDLEDYSRVGRAGRLGGIKLKRTAGLQTRLFIVDTRI
jgi:hypothetical protein